MTPFRRIVYGSSSPSILSDADIADILRTSRRNNAADGITGALLYADGNFIQVLEGPVEAVDRAYIRIQSAPRHRRLSMYLDQRTDERMFPDWSMGLIHADALTEEDRVSVRSVREAGAPAVGAARHLLLSFQKLNLGRPVARV